MKKVISIFVLFWSIYASAKVRVSIITSVYDGDKFIEQFLSEMVKQTIFDQCELLMIDANSPGSEREIILRYVEQYPQIKYIELSEDPGIYGVWNLGIQLAEGEYVTNANLDDGLAYDCYEKFVNVLDLYPNIDLVYADFYLAYQPGETFYSLKNKRAQISKKPEFSVKGLQVGCHPNNHPMWRKSMHKKYGFFDESYTSSGDYEMWVRAASQGALFKRVPEVLGFYYFNPYGISTKKGTVGREESKQIREKYAHVWR